MSTGGGQDGSRTDIVGRSLDLEQGLQILDAICETFRASDLPAAVAYLESGAQHMENAPAAFERWENKLGF
ncbi:MAG: hypothetical protein WBB22_12115 [Anaerolineae bacterium]